MEKYYLILQINKGASKDEIKKAFHKMAHLYHPDKPGGSAEKFKEVKFAYDALMSLTPQSEDFFVAYQEAMERQQQMYAEAFDRMVREAMIQKIRMGMYGNTGDYGPTGHYTDFFKNRRR